MKLFELNQRLYEEATEGSEGSEGTETGTEGEEGTEGTEGSEEGEESTEGDDLSEEDAKQAKSLFKLLKDPNVSTLVIRQLAERAGLLKDGIETPKDVKEAKKDLKAIIKEKLGSEYNFLSDKLGDAIEAVLEQERATQNAQLSQLQAQNTEQQVQTVLTKLANETKGESRKYESRMIELMDEFICGPNTPLEKYLRGLYAQATAGSTKAKVSNQIADKIKRNSTDVSSRIQSSSTSGKGASQKGTAPQKMSLNDSVNKALEELTKK